MPCPKCNRPHQGQCLMGTCMCFRCGKTRHFIRDCPKARVEAKSKQKGDRQKQFAQARLYALKPGEAETENEVVTSTLPLFSGKAIVLFNSDTTYYFISASYTRRYNISVEPLVVSTLVGKSVICTKMVNKCSIHIDGRTFS